MARNLTQSIISNLQSPVSALRRLVVAGIAAIVVASVVVSAAPPAGTPIPQPDVIFYGTASLGGEVIQSGTVKARLPRGDVIGVPVESIAGTDYTFSLTVPLSMYDPDNGDYAAGSARTGEAIGFYINDAAALFQDDNGVSRSEFVIPQDAVGETYVLDLAVVGPDAYPLGDVNANGTSDSADALLVLRYDVGLTSGGDTFPPAPGQIYVPLCDIVEDGKCNSSDALRILQCDVMMPGVTCPDDNAGVLAFSTLLAPADEAALVLRTEIAAGAEPGLVSVRVMADDPQAVLGAVSLELRYDADLLVPETCVQNPDSTLEAATCNVDFGPDAVRLNGVSTRGAGETTALAEITFRVLKQTALKDPSSTLKDLSRTLRLAVDGVFNVEGNELSWRAEGVPALGPSTLRSVPIQPNVPTAP